MIISAAVTIVVNGSIVAGVGPARLTGGRVVAPLTPIVVRLASRVSYDPASATLIIERNGVRIVVPVVFVENDMPYVALGPVVQRLGGSAIFDARTKTLGIVIRTIETIATPVPFDPALPQVEPRPVFTSAAPRPTPRGIESSAPHPRRTAIPAVPSQPVEPPRDSADLRARRR